MTRYLYVHSRQPIVYKGTKSGGTKMGRLYLLNGTVQLLAIVLAIVQERTNSAATLQSM